MKKYVLPASFVLTLICMGWVLYLHLHMPRVAYIRSGTILEQYAGVKEARLRYQQKTEDWKNQSDTLRQLWQSSYASMEKNYVHLTTHERTRQTQELEQQQADILRFEEATAAKAKQEEEKLMQGVFQQINSFVEKYAKEQGYTVVLGTTQSGSLLYASEGVDITDEVIKKLNESYKK